MRIRIISLTSSKANRLMGNELLPLEALTISGGPMDALAAATRKGATKNDVYEGKDQFIAVILKSVSPIELTQAETAAYLGTSKPADPNNSHGAIHGFKIRIISADSPHAFLPEPCFEGGTDAINNIIKDMHTLALSRGGTYSPGDEVQVQLEKTDFSYNLDSCWIIGPISANQDNYRADLSCLSAKDFFGGKTIAEFNSDIKSSLTKPGTPMVWPYKFGSDGRSALIGSEGKKDHVYDDDTGDFVTRYEDVKGYPTIGYGHLITEEEKNKYKRNLWQQPGSVPLTDKEIDELYKADINSREAQLNSLLGEKSVLTQEMYDATFSMGYNTGFGATVIKRVAASIKNKDYFAAATHISNGPDTSKGVFKPALKRRRQKEADEFASGGTPA